MTPLCEPSDLIQLLRDRHQTMALAESCTGGLIASKITDCPGASDAFMGSAVTYSNEAKESILGISQQTLLDHGAVSEEIAREMALGACRVYNADFAASVTGIAGPGGATAEKPVGLVYIAVSDGTRVVVSRNNFKGNRQEVREQTSAEAIRMLIDFIKGIL